MTVQAWVALKTVCQDPLTPRYGLKISKQTGLARGTIGGVRLVVKCCGTRAPGATAAGTTVRSGPFQGCPTRMGSRSLLGVERRGPVCPGARILVCLAHT